MTAPLRRNDMVALPASRMLPSPLLKIERVTAEMTVAAGLFEDSKQCSPLCAFDPAQTAVIDYPVADPRGLALASERSVSAPRGQSLALSSLAADKITVLNVYCHSCSPSIPSPGVGASMAYCGRRGESLWEPGTGVGPVRRTSRRS